MFHMFVSGLRKGPGPYGWAQTHPKLLCSCPAGRRSRRRPKAPATRPQKRAVPILPHDEFSPCTAQASCAPTRGAPGSHSQDTAAGTTPTWPLASGSMGCTLYNTPPEGFSPATSIKRISSSNPDGPLRDGCRRSAPPSTLGLFYPDAGPRSSRQPEEVQNRHLATAMDTHSRSRPR